MGVRYPSVSTTTFIGPLPANATETLCFTTPPLTIPLDSAPIFLHWMMQILVGASTTVLAFRIRRGTTITGTQIGANSWNQNVTAAQSSLVSGCYVDTPGAVAGQQYSLTVIQTGATVGGTFSDGCLLAFAL